MLEKLKKFADQAKEKATELAGKAAPAVSQGVEKAAGSLDKATKGRYTGHIDKVQGVVQQTAQKVGDKAAGTGTGTVAPPVTPVADFGEPDAVVIQPPSPVVIPSEPVVVSSKPIVVPPPPPVATFESEPGLDSPATTADRPEDKPQI
jgi:hypothetical protein